MVSGRSQGPVWLSEVVESPASTAGTRHSTPRGRAGNRARLEGRQPGCALRADISVFTAARAHHTPKPPALCQ